MKARVAIVALALFAAAPAAAQQLRTYTQSQIGAEFLTYGLPVPEPIESLTPVDGFRSYASLEARLQALALTSDDLSAHDVGPTLQNRALWAYVVGDADGVDVEGRAEAAFFINATTHAREWAAPEVATGTVERLIAQADDGGLTRYLLDNTRLVIIPVQNIDGLLQTQRFPTQALIGLDPDFPTTSPRDGRMRRKNMRGADEVLGTVGDHLNGIDLNRNHPPFWATSTSSSGNPASLIYHGQGAHSEPESQALLRAAALGPVTRMRLGIDVHSFSAVFYSSNTARTRLNNIQNRLLGVMAPHHTQLSGRVYANVPDPPNLGIGVAAEYFAYEWLVPAWTLELEPRNSATEYGATDVTHGGFILPASQVRRVRESWAETHAIAFYMMAGPPHLARLRVFDVASDALVRETRWQYDPASAQRQRITSASGVLMPARRYRAELSFSKPMRHRDASGAVVPLPGRPAESLAPAVTLILGADRTLLDTGSGVWLEETSRILRYRDDSFAFEFDAPADEADYQFEVAVTDMAGLALDADPSSPADWSNGAWSEYENAGGADGDFGGADRTTNLTVAAQAASQLQLDTAARVIGEGDAIVFQVARPVGGAERIELQRLDQDPPVQVALWQAGESGTREFTLSAPENIDADGDRTLQIALRESVDDAPGATFAIALNVLDNDGADRVVWTLAAGGDVAGAWAQLSGAQDPGELVLHGNASYALGYPDGGSPPNGLLPVRSDLSVHGNGARLSVSGTARGAALVTIVAGGSLSIDRVALVADDAPAAQVTTTQALIENDGLLAIGRSEIAARGEIRTPLIRNRGSLRLDRSGLNADALALSPPPGVAILHQTGGDTLLSASSVIAGDAGRATGMAVDLAAGSFVMRDSTLFGGWPLARVPDANPLRSTSSIVHESRNTPFTQPSDFRRPVCSSPLVAGQGENHFSASYEAGDAQDFLTSGCVTLDAFDVFGSDAPFVDPFAVAPLSFLAPIPSGPAVDRGAETDCGGVDQRGAPRPQAATPGTAPRCDIGALELGINPFRGIWSPERSGHGVELQTSGNRLLLVWYTYADDGQPTAYQAVAPLAGPHWSATLQRSSRNLQSGQVTLADVGTVSIDFDSDTEARLRWRFDARGVDGSERIRASLFGAGEPRVEVTGLWYPPQDSGYGATIARRGEATAIAIYYYDAQGSIRWALGTGNGADALELPMTSFTGFCPDCSASANPVVGQAAGRLLAHFLTPRRARLDMTLTYPGAAGGTWNRERAQFVPLSDPVDNRAAVATSMH